MPTPSRLIFMPPAIPSGTSWDVSSIVRAIDDHEIGQFNESAKLARSFGRDDRISPCATDRANALVGGDAADFSLQPCKSADLLAQSERLTKLITPWYDELFTDSWAKETLLDGIFLGFSLSYVVWERTAREWRPVKLIRWELEFSYWDQVRHAYVVTTSEGRTLHVDPNDPNWFIYAPAGARSWMAGAVRALGLVYLMRQWDMRDWARYNERHGLPIIVIKEPSGEREPGEKAAFYAGVKKMGRSGVVRAPQGSDSHDSYDVEFREATARTYDSFDKFKDALNTAVAVYLKGQNLTTEVQGGAYASTGWHMRVRKDYAENDAVAFGAAKRTLLQKWMRFNVSGADPAAAPWPTWRLEIPEDQTSVSTALAQGSSAMNELLSSPFRDAIDWNVLLNRLGVPLVEGAELTLGAPDVGTPGETV